MVSEEPFSVYNPMRVSESLVSEEPICVMEIVYEIAYLSKRTGETKERSPNNL